MDKETKSMARAFYDHKLLRTISDRCWQRTTGNYVDSNAWTRES